MCFRPQKRNNIVAAGQPLKPVLSFRIYIDSQLLCFYNEDFPGAFDFLLCMQLNIYHWINRD